MPPSLTTDRLIGVLNNSLRGLEHDLRVQALWKDHLPQTLTVAHTFSVPVKLTTITAPATVTGVAQIYVDSVSNSLVVRFGDGITKVVATDP